MTDLEAWETMMAQSNRKASTVDNLASMSSLPEACDVNQEAAENAYRAQMERMYAEVGSVIFIHLYKKSLFVQNLTRMERIYVEAGSVIFRNLYNNSLFVQKLTRMERTYAEVGSRVGAIN